MAVPLRNSRSIRAWPSAASPMTALLHEILIAGIADDGGAGAALPAARLQHQEILQRGLDVGRAGRGGDGHRRDVLEPPALAAQLLPLAGGHGALEIMLRARRRAPAGRVHGGRRLRAAACARQHRIERLRKRALLGEQRQQELRRHGRVAAEMIEPGGDHGLRLVAIDQRHAERRKRMRPAGQHRISRRPALDPRRETGRPACRRRSAPARRRRPRRTPAPPRARRPARRTRWARSRARPARAIPSAMRVERGEPAPLDLKCWTKRRVHGSSALKSGPR